MAHPGGYAWLAARAAALDYGIGDGGSRRPRRAARRRNFDRIRCEAVHIDVARRGLNRAGDFHTTEAGMHDRFDKSNETTDGTIYQRWGIGIFVLPVLLAAFLPDWR